MKMTITDVTTSEAKLDRWPHTVRKSRVHVWPEGETILENLMNRRDRPTADYRRQVLPALFERLGLPADTKATWSQRAGCRCGCSPAFVLDARTGLDYHVTVGAEAA